MVVVGLKSAGIGNCMFQYAAAKALAVKTKSFVKLDVSGLKEQQMPFRSYTDSDIMLMLEQSLGAFDIDLNVASDLEVQTLRGWGNERSVANKIKKKIRQKFGMFPATYFQEKKRHAYDTSLFNCTGDVYIDGLFINPRYFDDINWELKKVFQFKPLLDEKNLSVASEIASSDSVSIHVRRGDFANPVATGNIYPVYGRDYYKKAIEIIQEKVFVPKFYIFSDDIEWVSDNLDFIDNRVIVNHNSIDKGYADLWLMSICKHNIITNSTFSWWAAWLNDNPEKVVVCPEKWRNDTTDTSGMLVKDWFIL